MTRTQFLPPDEAVSLVWAATGLFSDDTESRVKGEHSFQEIQNKLTLVQGKNVGDAQRLYVETAVAKMLSSFRSIEIVHKGREQNFKEIEKLRAEYLKEIKARLDFGNKLTDLARSLPTMTVSGVGGITLVEIIKTHSNVPELSSWLVGIAAIAVGYWIQIFFNGWARRRKQDLLIKQDYDRNCYYQQYVKRVEAIIVDLFYELERLHKEYFDTYYNAKPDQVADTSVRGVIRSVNPTFCKHVKEHMAIGLATPDKWAKCEAGDQAARDCCPHWH